MESDITGMKKVISKVFLDHIALVATADDEVIDAVVAVDLKDVPENRHASHLHHRLGFEMGFFTEAGAQPTRKDDCLHSAQADRSKLANGARLENLRRTAA